MIRLFPLSTPIDGASDLVNVMLGVRPHESAALHLYQSLRFRQALGEAHSALRPVHGIDILCKMPSLYL